MPVVLDDKKLVGMITQSDTVAVMCRKERSDIRPVALDDRPGIDCT